MAPKSKPGSGNSDLKQEDILQAVVFADSFNTKFAPVSNDRPRASNVIDCLFLHTFVKMWNIFGGWGNTSIKNDATYATAHLWYCYVHFLLLLLCININQTP